MIDQSNLPLPGDADAMERIQLHHGLLMWQFALLRDNMLEAEGTGGADSARDTLVDWCRDVLFVHARAEERSFYPIALTLDDTRELAEDAHAEHAALAELVSRLAEAGIGERVGVAEALSTVLSQHLKRESVELIPAMALAARYSLTDIVLDLEYDGP